MGNIAPVAWRADSNYLLRVADNGEQAEILAAGTLPDQKTPSEWFAELYGATADEVRAIGSVATVGTENKTVFISRALPAAGRLAIGGVVLHTDQAELALLQGMFPETPIPLPGEG